MCKLSLNSIWNILRDLLRCFSEAINTNITILQGSNEKIPPSAKSREIMDAGRMHAQVSVKADPESRLVSRIWLCRAIP